MTSALPLFALLLFATSILAAADDIKKVYVVFSNHLDVGYTDNQNGSCAGAVVNR